MLLANVLVPGFSVQSRVLSSKRKKGRSKCNGNTLHSYNCEEVEVDVSLTATWEHSDDHLALVLLSRSDLKTHLKGSLYEPLGSETGMREEESVS